MLQSLVKHYLKTDTDNQNQCRSVHIVLYLFPLFAVLRHCTTGLKVAGSIPDGVDSDSNRTEYQGLFLGVKAAGA
jgi:hypothetical protein